MGAAPGPAPVAPVAHRIERLPAEQEAASSILARRTTLPSGDAGSHPDLTKPAPIGDRCAITSQMELRLEVKWQKLWSLRFEDRPVLRKDPILEFDHRRVRLVVHGHPHPGRAVDRVVWGDRKKHAERELAMLDEGSRERAVNAVRVCDG